MPWNKDGTRKKSSSYKMKYSNSAFPFKSPLKDHEKDKDGNVIEHKTTKSDTTWTEVPGSRTTEVMGTKEDEKNMRKNMSGGKNAGKSSKSRMLDAFNDEFPD